MRDPKRIARVMELLQAIWEKQPDSRFFQLVSWLECEFSKQNGDFGKLELFERDERGIETPRPMTDLFYLEDARFEAFLEKFFESL